MSVPSVGFYPPPFTPQFPQSPYPAPVAPFQSQYPPVGFPQAPPQPVYAPPAPPASAPQNLGASNTQQQAKAINAGYVAPTSDTSVLSAQIAELAQSLAKNNPNPYGQHNRWYA